LIININRSKQLGAIVAVLFVSSTLIILLSPINIGLKIALLGFIGVVCLRSLARFAWLSDPRSIVSVDIGENKIRIHLFDEPARSIPSRVVKSFVSNHLVTALIEELNGGRRHRLIVMRPMFEKEQFRNLKRFLLQQSR